MAFDELVAKAGLDIKAIKLRPDAPDKRVAGKEILQLMAPYMKS